MIKSKNGKERNLGVEGFRFLLILYVVLFHYTYRFGEIFGSSDSIGIFKSGGIVGNCLFYVISGFFLNRYLMRKNGTLRDCVIYVINKYWRLWPIYAVTVVIVYLVSIPFPLPNKTVDLNTAIVNFFFIYHPKFDYVDGAHWFIADLLLFQLLFGISILLRDNIKSHFIKLTAIYPLSVFLLNYFDVVQFSDYYYNLACPYFLSFYLGMVICDYINNEKNIFNYVWLLLTVLFWIITTKTVVSFIFLLFFLFLLYDKRFIANKFLGNRIFVYLGGISYSWYLIHQNIGYTIIYYLEKVIPYNLLVLVAVISTIFMAAALNALTIYFPKKIV